MQVSLNDIAENEALCNIVNRKYLTMGGQQFTN